MKKKKKNIKMNPNLKKNVRELDYKLQMAGI